MSGLLPMSLYASLTGMSVTTQIVKCTMLLAEDECIVIFVCCVSCKLNILPITLSSCIRIWGVALSETERWRTTLNYVAAAGFLSMLSCSHFIRAFQNILDQFML